MFDPTLKFRTLLVIDRQRFSLELWVRPMGRAAYKRVARYGVAVGAKGFATPPGAYQVNSRAECPEWLVPDSDWARDAKLVPGTVVPGCSPENPLKERWLGFTDDHDVGIHGTGDLASIGTRASHGCIRMRPEDVIALYDRVPRGATVVIG